jgi:hypothetical protein
MSMTDVRALTRHLNAIGYHAVEAENILGPLVANLPNGFDEKAEWVEVLAIIRMLLETWDAHAKRMIASDAALAEKEVVTK